MSEWSIQQAREMYHVAHWSDGFFDVNESGALRVQPHGLHDQNSIDLNELAKTINESGVSFPIFGLKWRLDAKLMTLNPGSALIR